MAALQQSPVALRPKPSPPSISSPISASLRPLRPLRRRIGGAVTISRFAARRRGAAVMVASPAGSYATALSDIANSNGTLDPTVADVEKVDKFFANSGVASFFANPTIPIGKKKAMIAELAVMEELQPHTANFLNLLVDMKRTELMSEIVEAFEARINKITGTELAVVTSVVPLESQHLSQIAQTVQRFTAAKNVRIKTKIDASLIAGFTIRYGGSGSKLIDMSVKKQLDEIAANLDFSSITLA